jgi:hypothetical protein
MRCITVSAISSNARRPRGWSSSNFRPSAAIRITLASSAYRALHWWALLAPTVGAANERHNHGFEVKRNGFRLTARGTSRRRGSSESKITKARKAPEPIRKCWYTTPSPCRRTSLRRPFHLDRSPKQAFRRRCMLSRICLPNTPASAHANLPE